MAAVRDDPRWRLELAARWYDRRPGRASIRPYRRAEVAFMRWQISRGVLASPTGPRPGSPWWRAVNEDLIRDTWEADLLDRGLPGRPTRPSVRQWMRFLAEPSAGNWYRAHNSSIVAGYLDHRDLAQLELPVERFFMDVALQRVLYAHSLVAAPQLALGKLAPLGRFLGDPRLRMADVFLSLRRILPDRYPLTGFTVDEILELENRVGRLLDYSVIVPRLAALYAFAARELREPRLLGLIRGGAPVYAWPYEERDVWTMVKTPLTARAVERMTRAAD
ncbi:MAG: hypothetical protein ACXWZG_01060 [Microbacterium sp.]